MPSASFEPNVAGTFMESAMTPRGQDNIMVPSVPTAGAHVRIKTWPRPEPDHGSTRNKRNFCLADHRNLGCGYRFIEMTDGRAPVVEPGWAATRVRSSNGK